MIRGIQTDPIIYNDNCMAAQGKCFNATASTTSIIIPDLAGYGDDFFNNHYYMQVIKNANSAGNAPEHQVRKITDYVSASGTFTTDTFGANVESGDEVLILHESVVAIGRDDADNVFASTNVTANRDGSLLERTEFIISMITGGAGDLRVSQSVAGTVEEAGFLQFTVGLMDIDTGAIVSANIDITGITQTMERSRGGAAWSAMTAPVFAKMDGQVYCSYEFLAAEWQTGDMYRLTLSGIVCTIGTATAYVPAMIWSNVVVETEDIKNDVQYLYAVADGGTHAYPDSVTQESIFAYVMSKESDPVITSFNNTTDSLEAIADEAIAIEGKVDAVKTVADNIYIDTQAISIVVSDIQTNLIPDLSADVSSLQTDIGDPSARTNLKSIEAMLGNPDAVGKTVYGNVGDFVGNTNLKTLKDALAIPDTAGKGLYTEIVTDRLDNATYGLSALNNDLDTIITKLGTGVGQPQVFTKAITSAADAGDVTVATVTTQPVLIKSLTVHSDGATTTDLTSIAISGGAGKVIEFITATEGARTNLDAQDKQVSWPDLGSAGIYFPAGATIVATLAGTGSTAVDLNVIIEYVSTVSGGYLA